MICCNYTPTNLPSTMSEEQYLKCTLDVSFGKGAVTRVLGSSLQTLVASAGGLTASGLPKKSSPELYEAKAEDEATTAPRRPFVPREWFGSPIWDPWSSSFYAIHGHAIVRITGDEVSLLAGSVEEGGDEDGVGSEARFTDPTYLASDKAGCLYCAGYNTLRKVRLPLALRCIETGVAAPAAARDKTVVSTLPFCSAVFGLVHVPYPSDGPGSLVYATSTALYRMQMRSTGGATAPVLLAGQEGVQGSADGREQEARFRSISGLAVDGQGNILCGDTFLASGNLRTALRRVALDGTVTTLLASKDGGLQDLWIFSNGYLALLDFTNNT